MAPAIETASRLFGELFGKPCEVAGLTMADQLQFWQWQNRVAIAVKAEAIMKAHSIARRVLPTGFLLQFVRDSGDIADDNLQTAWANLLASATESDANDHVAFVHSLKQLSPIDAIVLTTLIDAGPEEPKTKPAAIAKLLGLSKEQVAMSYAVFEHLGFFTPTRSRLKTYAIRFIRACFANDEALDLYLERQSSLPYGVVVD
jgi:hypothetical protein